MMTGGPSYMPPTPTDIQPSVPPAQDCTKAADCTPPPPTCYASSVVSYVGAACEAGSCAWEVSLSQCPVACLAGACGDVQCHTDADCAVGPATCHATDQLPSGWYVTSCPAPSCQGGTCVCNSTYQSCDDGETCDGGACVLFQ
jgi:hypothetical protein